jgi:hypothetical protein
MVYIVISFFKEVVQNFTSVLVNFMFKKNLIVISLEKSIILINFMFKNSNLILFYSGRLFCFPNLMLLSQKSFPILKSLKLKIY